jgi:hypothetical protein
MKLVVVTQRVDPADPGLGATVDKLRALAARVDELVVMADSAVEGVMPANCRVRPYRSKLRAGRGLRFETALARELASRPRPSAVLAHMCPIYAVLAACTSRRHEGAPLVHALAAERPARSGRAALDDRS